MLVALPLMNPNSLTVGGTPAPTVREVAFTLTLETRKVYD